MQEMISMMNNVKDEVCNILFWKTGTAFLCNDLSHCAPSVFLLRFREIALKISRGCSRKWLEEMAWGSSFQQTQWEQLCPRKWTARDEIRLGILLTSEHKRRIGWTSLLFFVSGWCCRGSRWFHTSLNWQIFLNVKCDLSDFRSDFRDLSVWG